MTSTDPNASAETLAETLRKLGDQKIVFAESCTCGMAAALMGQVRGISEFLCGSLVSYREASKASWLRIDADEISKHKAESAEVTRQMAVGALESTTEATWSAAITGHLEPGQEVGDGVVYIAIGVRAWNEAEEEEIYLCTENIHKLSTDERIQRQHEAANLLLQVLNDCLVNLESD